jgi:hypothetical protein
LGSTDTGRGDPRRTWPGEARYGPASDPIWNWPQRSIPIQSRQDRRRTSAAMPTHGTRSTASFFLFCSDQIWRPALWFDWPTKDMDQTRSGGRARRAEWLAIPRSSGLAGRQEPANLRGRAWERTRSLLFFLTFPPPIGSPLMTKPPTVDRI